MSTEEYFSFAPEAPYAADAPTASRKPSTSSNPSLRSLLVGTWTELPPIPATCRTVSFSSWRRFSAAPVRPTPKGGLKASDLCIDRGQTPDFDPPASEWCYLGVDQPPVDPKYQNLARARGQRRRPRQPQRTSTSSWATVSEEGEEGTKPEPIKMNFSKRPLKRVNTNSLLTESFAMPAKEEKVKTMAERLGLEGLTCEELPSAFDSDDEED
ncbi:hypothetical protein BDW02DRAFT_556935 [Decorospora gaudefroyi]|uniref:Uncharacterized protein n=1 Tax=Decorospora gaudefroyi TaxID=184978 RepID=A0A6A5KAC3_9PLEO|nr:hypothetical protein BDW02DRAFT_556935 [Decorospora gaudefroyi]